MRNEEARAVTLRQGNLERAYYQQGIIDGINLAMKEIKVKATRPKEDGGPLY